jgi:diacylglycerol O-acyltransferase / wax synthase
MTESDPFRQLDTIVPITRAAKNPRRVVSPAAFTIISRMLVGTRMAQHVINHQRLVHTFVTNVRGPQEPLALAGRRVVAAMPVSVVSGNVAVAFGVLSYAGTLAITVVADPQHFPDLDVVAAALQADLGALLAPSQTTPPARDQGPLAAV